MEIKSRWWQKDATWCHRCRAKGSTGVKVTVTKGDCLQCLTKLSTGDIWRSHCTVPCRTCRKVLEGTGNRIPIRLPSQKATALAYVYKE